MCALVTGVQTWVFPSCRPARARDDAPRARPERYGRAHGDLDATRRPGAGFSGRPDKLAMLPRRCARLAGDAGAALGAAATRRAARRNLPARGRALYEIGRAHV